MRTVAPNDFGGRLFLNCARTTPELPRICQPKGLHVSLLDIHHTVWPGDLAPHHPYLGSPDLLLCAVDESDLLAEVEATMHAQQKL